MSTSSNNSAFAEMNWTPNVKRLQAGLGTTFGTHPPSQESDQTPEAGGTLPSGTIVDAPCNSPSLCAWGTNESGTYLQTGVHAGRPVGGARALQISNRDGGAPENVQVNPTTPVGGWVPFVSPTMSVGKMDRNCQICLERPRSVRFLPCRHATFCQECYDILVARCASPPLLLPPSPPLLLSLSPSQYPSIFIHLSTHLQLFPLPLSLPPPFVCPSCAVHSAHPPQCDSFQSVARSRLIASRMQVQRRRQMHRVREPHRVCRNSGSSLGTAGIHG